MWKGPSIRQPQFGARLKNTVGESKPPGSPVVISIVPFSAAACPQHSRTNRQVPVGVGGPPKSSGLAHCATLPSARKAVRRAAPPFHHGSSRSITEWIVRMRRPASEAPPSARLRLYGRALVRPCQTSELSSAAVMPHRFASCTASM